MDIPTDPGRGGGPAEARAEIDPVRVAETPAASSPPGRTPLTATFNGASGHGLAELHVEHPRRRRRPLIVASVGVVVALVLLAGVAYRRSNIAGG